MKPILSFSLLLLIAASGCKKQAELNGVVDEVKTEDEGKYYIPSSDYSSLTSKVSAETVFNYSGKSVRVKVYSRDVADTKNSPIFKYGDLLNRAISYKVANPDSAVRIKFPMYKAGFDAYIGFNPSHSTTYGFVKGNDFGGDNSEKLIYSIVKAARYQVYVDFVYHLDNTSESVYNYINAFMDSSCFSDPSKKVRDYLRLRKISWGTEAYQQMHAKFMTVSHYAGDGEAVFNTVFCTTGNVDEHNTSGIPSGKDWVQSGMLINGHAGLMQSYNTYFDLIYAHASSQSNFATAVRALHATNSLNYDDQHFSSYFTPIPVYPAGNYVGGQADSSALQGNAWDTTFNPVAKYVSRMANVSGDRYIKVNVYHLKTDNFGKKFYNELAAIYNSPQPGLKHFRFLARTNTYQSSFPASNFNNIGIMRYPAATHAKDLLFAFSGPALYYTITGSTNLKLDENVSKANSSVVVKEYTTAHPVYNAYKEVYEYQY